MEISVSFNTIPSLQIVRCSYSTQKDFKFSKFEFNSHLFAI